uniref:DUF669 domain-containing protein n=1 Tax=viral metagenome TaxID=1070528 RepID=A0A6M3IPT2_9ZZZZ
MPTIDLAVNFEDVKNEDIIEAVPNGTYDFVVSNITKTVSKSSGRDMLKWELDIPYDGKTRKLFYNTVLPFINPETNELDVSGVGMLVAVCKGVNQPWTGGQLNTEDYLGRGGRVEVIQKPKQTRGPDGEYQDDLTAPPVNAIKHFVY